MNRHPKRRRDPNQLAKSIIDIATGQGPAAPPRISEGCEQDSPSCCQRRFWQLQFYWCSGTSFTHAWGSVTECGFWDEMSAGMTCR
jgi:hypothetical protein